MRIFNLLAPRWASKLIAATLLTAIGGLANAQQVSSLTINPNALIGGVGATGTVTLSSPAPASGFVVGLSSNDGAASVGPTATVSFGSSTATFPITTTAVPANVVATIKATGGGGTAKATLAIKAPRLKQLTVSPGSIVGSKSAIGAVLLNSNAPVGGFVVSLYSDSSCATVLGTTTVPSGSHNATFTINTLPVGSDTLATITGSAAGVDQSGTLLVQAPTVTGVTLNPAVVSAGQPSTGTVTLNVAVGTAPYDVALSSNAGIASTLSTVSVQPGKKTATFTVNTFAGSNLGLATITAQTGSVSASATLKVVTAPWPKFRGDAQGTGQGAGPGGNGVFKWLFQTAGEVGASPIIAQDGTVYFGSCDGCFYAMLPNGKQKWKVQLPDMVQCTPAIGADGTLYVGCYDGYLYGINPAGAITMMVNTFGPITSNPAIGTDGTIYVGSTSGLFYAINPNGTPKWYVSTSGFVWSSPAIAADGTVYFCAQDKYMYAVSPTGTKKWKFPLSGLGDCSPTIGADGTIYVGSGYQGDGTFLAINPNGSQKWSFSTGGPVQSSAAIANDGTIYFGSNDGNLYALNQDGTLKWTYMLGGWVFSSPSIASNGCVYVAGTPDISNGNLFAINPDGTKKWSYHVDAYITSSAALGLDGSVYITSGDGKLYRFK